MILGPRICTSSAISQYFIPINCWAPPLMYHALIFSLMYKLSLLIHHRIRLSEKEYNCTCSNKYGHILYGLEIGPLQSGLLLGHGPSIVVPIPTVMCYSTLSGVLGYNDYNSVSLLEDHLS